MRMLIGGRGLTDQGKFPASLSSSGFDEREVAVGYGRLGISISDGSGSKKLILDIAEYHDYQINYTAGSNMWELLIDSTSVASGLGNSYSRSNSLGFGDGAGAANASWKMTAYTFTQNAASVPESATMLLVGTGLAGFIAARRRKKP